VVGLASGLIAAWTMNQFQEVLARFSQSHQDAAQQPLEPQEESEDATMKAANKISRNVLHRELSRQEKKIFGPVVHYAFGGTMGALYAVAVELAPRAVTGGFGTRFGTTLFAVADELAVPSFGLSKGPKEVPLSSHTSALFAHLAYGVTLETVRRVSMAIF
jgi:putative membrane protein